MKKIIRNIIRWALDIKDQPSNAQELDNLAKELKGS
jgi:hypothetical protein